MATIQEENCSLYRTSCHLAVVSASGAQKNKLSLQRHSSVTMLSFDTEVEELNIASDQGRHNDDSLYISTKFEFHNKRQSFVAEAVHYSIIRLLSLGVDRYIRIWSDNNINHLYYP